MGTCRVAASSIVAVSLLYVLTTAASASVLITVDKDTQRMTVAVDGQVRWVWPVSTGVARYDTPDGQYTAFRMEADHYSKEWDDAPMPHSIFFTKEGHAIHGAVHTPFGRPASHGCVRLSLAHAAELYALVQREGLPNTKVVIEGDIPHAPLVASREPVRERAAGDDEQQSRQLPLQLQPQQQQQRQQALASPDEDEADASEPRDDSGPGFPGLPFFGSQPAPQAQPVQPQTRAVRRAYVAPRGYTPDRRYGSRAYYAPTVEVTEDSYVNGVRVRRHYVRHAAPSDFR